MQRVCGAERRAGACRQVHRRASLCSMCAVLSGGLVLVGRYIEGLACAACVRWAGACRQVHRSASLCSVCAVLSGGLVLVGRYTEGLASAACVWC